ncbi:MAG: hypothetical protein M1831_004801 [Alyxoria varia]|nr:MAG: hypothetical protein M1831_004801 [Alyxoria varia]
MDQRNEKGKKHKQRDNAKSKLYQIDDPEARNLRIETYKKEVSALASQLQSNACRMQNMSQKELMRQISLLQNSPQASPYCYGYDTPDGNQLTIYATKPLTAKGVQFIGMVGATESEPAIKTEPSANASSSTNAAAGISLTHNGMAPPSANEVKPANLQLIPPPSGLLVQHKTLISGLLGPPAKKAKFCNVVDEDSTKPAVPHAKKRPNFETKKKESLAETAVRTNSQQRAQQPTPAVAARVKKGPMVKEPVVEKPVEKPVEKESRAKKPVEKKPVGGGLVENKPVKDPMKRKSAAVKSAAKESPGNEPLKKTPVKREPIEVITIEDSENEGESNSAV